VSERVSERDRWSIELISSGLFWSFFSSELLSHCGSEFGESVDWEMRRLHRWGEEVEDRW
jgi:hypothetical protein